MARIAEFEAPFTSLPFDDSCVPTYGHIRSELEQAGTPIGPNDLMIAAIALTHGLTLVTHNTREFKRVARLSWADWES
jgi:tRNA(fMet)-specific endonuclease VapC